MLRHGWSWSVSIAISDTLDAHIRVYQAGDTGYAVVWWANNSCHNRYSVLYRCRSDWDDRHRDADDIDVTPGIKADRRHGHHHAASRPTRGGRAGTDRRPPSATTRRAAVADVGDAGRGG